MDRGSAQRSAVYRHPAQLPGLSGIAVLGALGRERNQANLRCNGARDLAQRRLVLRMRFQDRRERVVDQG